MRTLPTIDIESNWPKGPLERPVYLSSDIFYTPADISPSPELEAVADRLDQTLARVKAAYQELSAKLG